jgi:hypothetical protein
MGTTAALLLSLALSSTPAPEVAPPTPSVEHPVLLQHEARRSQRRDALLAAQRARDAARLAARTAPAYPSRQDLPAEPPAAPPAELTTEPAGLAKRCAFETTDAGLEVVCLAPAPAAHTKAG